MAPAGSTSVQVALRIRPSTNQDLISIPTRFQRTVIHATSSTSVSVDASNAVPSSGAGGQAQQSPATAPPAKKQTFTFDTVLGQQTTQHELYLGTAQPLIERFVEGFNCTILAYGQTSSGKTYSMTGIDLDGDPTDPYNGMGITPRSIAEIFARARALKEQRGPAWNFSIKGSFIELYNEDLIDLLAEGAGRREVQIREDKDGTIIWGGLREVEVRTPKDVMNLIRSGSSLRRTNETDMNAQSSRSHAIFSLTLIQRKHSGGGGGSGGNSGGRSTPLSPPTASRIARPGSMSMGTNSRVSSPTFGRPQTPSFATAMGRGAGGRPGSSLGQNGRPGTPDDDGPGEWSTVVSKFHFVDLAGSERLKRTAAAGDRAKEGISINSGLLALGNVISALGDPQRAKAATHIPYRDSKLTRLLQDSLGGNAHTLMLACVSPAEYNAAETTNTLKYANRARNIKNRAEIREKEEGWDDLEWLQNMINRLRKEVKALKEGGALPADSAAATPAPEADGSSKKVLAQFVELQENYQELRERYVERTEELTRLRRELGEQHRGSGGAAGGISKYEEIVGPVIEEYEKTISSIEAELKLNRAALRHTNELVAEKDDELASLGERHSKTESYVAELRSRISRLSERESSTESYIQDLEEKIKSFDDTSLSSSSSVSELKKELAKYRDTESHHATYIADLEARLARSDESVLTLRATVEKFELEADARRSEVELLQSRLEALKADGEGWRSELEARERKVADLERQLVSWEARLSEAGIDRERLGELMNGVEQAKTDLERNIAKVQESSSHDGEASSSLDLQDQLVSLQQTHTATLADLSVVSSKYRDALREISELAERISVAKLQKDDDTDNLDSPNEEPPVRRRRGTLSSSRPREGAGSGDITPSPSRRRFFRHAASSDSLHARSQSQSQSLSQELSSARSSKPSSSRSLTSRPSSRTGSPTLGIPPVPPLLLHVTNTERSAESLQKEIMRLQEVLKEREAEITMLEQSLKESTPRTDSPVAFDDASRAAGILSPSTIHQFDEIRKSVVLDGEAAEPVQVGEPLDRLDELMRSMAQKESTHREKVNKLETQIQSQETELQAAKKQYDDLIVLSRDQALNVSNELEGLRDRLRLSEQSHDSAKTELNTLKAQEAELIAKHAEELRAAEEQHAATRAELGQLRTREAELVASLDQQRRTTEEDRTSTSAAHDSLKAREQELVAAQAAATEQHTAELEALRAELKAREEQLVASQAASVEQHSKELDALRAEHNVALQAKTSEIDSLVSRVQQNDADIALSRDQLAAAMEALKKANEAHEDDLTGLRASHAAEVARLAAEAEHLRSDVKVSTEAATKRDSDHQEAVARLEARLASQLEDLRKEHAAELERVESARQGLLSDSQESQLSALKQLEGAHAVAIKEKEACFAAELESVKTESARALAALTTDHESVSGRLKEEHSRSLAMYTADRDAAQDRLKDEHARTLSYRVSEHESALSQLKQDHSRAVAALEASHATERERIASQHETALKEAKQVLFAAHAKQTEDTRLAHAEELSKLQQQVAEVNAAHAATRSQHDGALATLQSDHQAALETARADSTRAGAADIEALRGNHEKQLLELKDSHAEALRLAVETATSRSAELEEALLAHAKELFALKESHLAEVRAAEDALSSAQSSHEAALEAARTSHEQVLSEERDHQVEMLAELDAIHSRERNTIQKDLELQREENAKLAATLAQLKTSSDSSTAEIQARHEAQAQHIATLEQDLASSRAEHSSLASEVATLKEQLQLRTAELRQHEPVVQEAATLRSQLDQTRDELSRSQVEADAIQAEKVRQDTLIKELQAQIASLTQARASPSIDRSANFVRSNSNTARLPPASPPPSGPPPSIPPPSGPPPSVPPPPVPSDASSVATDSTRRTALARSSDSSRGSIPDSPNGTISTTFTSLPSTNGHVDPKVVAQLEEKDQVIEEQETMIRTLNKQLTHCEGDLQAHMDLVGTLETSLSESERNLRKARMQSADLAKERDSLKNQVDSLRGEVTDAKSEVANIRRSVVEEKLTLENRLDEERRAKERARAQLDSRMEELQRRKSKFICL